MKRVAGTSKKSKKKKQADFVQVLLWVLGVALVLVLIWGLQR